MSEVVSDAGVQACLAADVQPRVLRATVRFLADLAVSGREGKRVGALFVLGDAEAVLRRSYPLILDPLAGHPAEAKSILLPQMRGTLRELTLLDGAFVVTTAGVVVSAARCLDVRSAGLHVPMGLGSRHRAAASITQETEAVAVVLSQSRAVRVFRDGVMVHELRGAIADQSRALVQRLRPAGAARSGGSHRRVSASST